MNGNPVDTSSFFELLTSEDAKILLDECDEQIGQLKARLTLLILERDEITKKLLLWKSQRDTIELLKSGADFNNTISSTSKDTLDAIQERYLSAMKRYDTMFKGSGDKKKKGRRPSILDMSGVDEVNKANETNAEKEGDF